MEELVLYTPKILLYIFKIVPSLGRSGIPGLGMITTANPTLHNPVMPLELGVTKRTVKPQNAQYNLRADFPVKDHVGAPIKLLGMFTSHVGLTDCQSIGVYLTDEEHGFATISGLSVKFHGQKDQQLSGNALILGTIHEERFFEIVEFDVSSGEELQGILIHRAIKPIGYGTVESDAASGEEVVTHREELEEANMFYAMEFLMTSGRNLMFGLRLGMSVNSLQRLRW